MLKHIKIVTWVCIIMGSIWFLRSFQDASFISSVVKLFLEPSKNEILLGPLNLIIIIADGLLLVGGVGLLWFKEWGRKAIYAWMGLVILGSLVGGILEHSIGTVIGWSPVFLLSVAYPIWALSHVDTKHLFGKTLE